MAQGPNPFTNPKYKTKWQQYICYQQPPLSHVLLLLPFILQSLVMVEDKNKRNHTFLLLPLVSFLFILFFPSSLFNSRYLIYYYITKKISFEYHIQILLSKLFLKFLFVESLYHYGLQVWSNYKLYKFSL
jgi:hypothetical protein